MKTFALAVIWRLLLLGGIAPFLRATGIEPIEVARALAGQNLTYKYGADNPATGSLDCSGFMMVAFKQSWNIALPDEAGKQFEYIRQHGEIWDATTPKWSPKMLQPGDLIFWTGTYKCNRPSPITHVMMYMGNNTMVGSQNHGKRIDIGSPGVGYYYFKPRAPQGNPLSDQTPYREKVFLYAYGRLKKPAPGTIPTGEIPTALRPNIGDDPSMLGR